MNARIRAVLAGLPRDPPPIPPAAPKKVSRFAGKKSKKGGAAPETAAEAGEEAGARDAQAQGARGSLLHLPRAHQGARRHGVVLLPRLPRVVSGDARAPRQGRRHDAPLRRRDVPAVPQARAGLPRRHAVS